MINSKHYQYKTTNQTRNNILVKRLYVKYVKLFPWSRIDLYLLSLLNGDISKINESIYCHIKTLEPLYFTLTKHICISYSCKKIYEVTQKENMQSYAKWSLNCLKNRPKLTNFAVFYPQKLIEFGSIMMIFPSEVWVCNRHSYQLYLHLP